jgi:hypothetical protein
MGVRRRTAWMVLPVLVAGPLAVPGPASANVPGTSTTRLASRTPDGRFPDGRSQDPAISQDQKRASLVAYDSVASDIVPGDTNAVSDVFVVRRAQPYDDHAQHATRWEPGSTDLISTGLGGAPADGPSYLPDLDGDQLHASHCVAFVSAADNLVPDDTNGQPDAFVKDLRSGTIRRVSVNTAGGQADGPTFDVQVDGACDRVAFTSSADNLAYATRPLPKVHVAGGRLAPNPRGRLMTGPPPPGTRQVYVRILGGEHDDKRLTGVTFLASATSAGTPGDADSYDAQLGELGDGCPQSCGTTSGDTVAFTSDATNLSLRDTNGRPDVYEHSFRIPTQHFRARRTKRPAYVRTRTLLVSTNASGEAGNGGSDQPSINDSGQHVAFRTAATNLVSDGGNGVTNVVLANTDTGRLTLVSRTSMGNVVGNGPSSNPVVSRNASVLFQSAADNIAFVPGADKNCVADILFWNPVNEHVATESTDSSDLIPGSPFNPNTDPCPPPNLRTVPAENPATSYYDNFVAFEHNDPLIDLGVADAVYPGLRRDRARASSLARNDPALHQVYMHLVGP